MTLDATVTEDAAAIDPIDPGGVAWVERAAYAVVGHAICFAAFVVVATTARRVVSRTLPKMQFPPLATVFISIGSIVSAGVVLCASTYALLWFYDVAARLVVYRRYGLSYDAYQQGRRRARGELLTPAEARERECERARTIVADLNDGLDALDGFEYASPTVRYDAPTRQFTVECDGGGGA